MSNKTQEAWSKGYKHGFAAAMFQAARIADGHRAINLDAGLIEAGVACSSVAAFIVQEARERGCWDDSLPQPLIPAKSDAAS
jgi:hypothetical protein